MHRLPGYLHTLGRMGCLLRLLEPGRAALGSPVAFSFLELERKGPAEGVHYSSFSGHVPEYYYTCEIEPEMCEWASSSDGDSSAASDDFSASMSVKIEIDFRRKQDCVIRVLLLNQYGGVPSYISRDVSARNANIVNETRMSP